MARQILDATKIHPKALNVIETNYADIVTEVQEAINENALVIVGMVGQLSQWFLLMAP